MTYIHQYLSPMGQITLASNGEALTGLWFEGQKYFGSTLDSCRQERNLFVFEETKRWLDLYFQRKCPDFIPPLLFSSTPFRQAVWKILLTIPYGKTVSYGAIARTLQVSAQAVGGAVGHNPISIIVPCHRVVATNGNLIGYAAGLEKKAALLSLEKADISACFTTEKGV